MKGNNLRLKGITEDYSGWLIFSTSTKKYLAVIWSEGKKRTLVYEQDGLPKKGGKKLVSTLLKDLAKGKKIEHIIE